MYMEIFIHEPRNKISKISVESLNLSPFQSFQLLNVYHQLHCLKSVRIWDFSGPYSVWIRENTDQKNSEYRHLSRSVTFEELRAH